MVKNVKKQSVKICPKCSNCGVSHKATYSRCHVFVKLRSRFILSTLLQIRFSSNMKFALLNAQSFATAKYDLSTLTSDYNIDILCFDETWDNKNSTIPHSLPNFRCFSRPRPTDPHGGVAIFIKQNGRLSAFLVDTCYKHNHQDLEILALIVKTHFNIIFHLIVAYIPPSKTEQMKLLSYQIS